MLPFWPRLYCALCIDIDHRVRESTQLTHAAVVKRVGKSIAIYLKQLAGAWFTSQYDTYPPAASAAFNSFTNTFPPWKIIDAIIHCQYEILSYINDNIIMQTTETSMQKVLISEEMETKYQRILVANLQGYNSYFKKVPLCEIDKTLEIHDKILNSSKFWKLAKYDATPVQIAFFNVLTSIIENAAKLLQNEKKKTITTIMNSLDVSEPGILSAVWESMLVAITKIDDWHLVVNIDKLVLPKLWRVLQSGGQCCAGIVYPNLLPFVSHFPKLSININDLYMNFFDNMRQGFFAKSVQISRSEMLAVIISFVECIRYSILVNAENVDLCIRLFKEQLMPVIEACMTENISMKQLCFPEITHLVRYWSKNRTNEEYKSYIFLMQHFWTELRLLFDKLITISQDITVSHNMDAKDAYIEFMIILKNAPDHTRKKLKVHFSDPNNSIMSQPEIKVTETDTDTIFTLELCELVNAICIIYFNKVNDQHFTEYIEKLNKLIKHFSSRELFVALLKSKLDKNFFEFYDNNLRPLLLNNLNTIDQVLNFIFYFVTYANDVDKNKVLNSLIELNDIAITRNVLNCSLSRCNRNDHIIKKWYTQPSVTKLLIDVAKEIVSSEYSEKNLEKNQNLILLALETLEVGDLLINEKAANEIISIFCHSLSGTDNTCSIQFIAFITKLMFLTWGHKQTISSAVQILETLFELCTREHNYTDLISTAIMRNNCKKGFIRSSQILSRFEFNNLIKRCAVIIWSKIYNAHTVHVKDMLIDLATDVLNVIIKDNIESDCIEETILSFLMASDIELWIAEATTVAIYGEIVTGNLYVSNIEKKIQISDHYVSIDIMNDIILDNTVNCLSWALFITDLLNNLYERQISRNMHIDDTNISTNTEKNELYDFNLPEITEVLVNIIYVATIAKIYNKHYKSTKYCNDVNKLLNSFEDSFVNLQKHFTNIIHNKVLPYIQTNHSSYGYMLSYIIRTYYTEFEPNMLENPIKYYESYSNKEECNEEAYIQAIQILSDYWMPENISLLTNNYVYTLITARIMICLKDNNYEYTAIMEKVLLYHKEDPALLFLNHDVSDVSWSQLLLPLEVIRLLTTLIQKVPSKLTYKYWDFILISLTMWQQSVKKSKHNYTNIKVTALITAISQLYYELQTLMNKHERKSIAELPPTLLDEWKNVFADDIYSNIIQTWMFCVTLRNQDTTIKSTIPLNYLGKAISILDKNILFKRYNKDTKEINFNKMLELSVKLLQSPVPSIQLGAYYVLKHMVLELVQYDKTLFESDNFEPSSLHIRKLEEVLLNTQNIVNTMLIEFK